MKIKRNIVGILAILLLIATGIAPIKDVQASAETATTDMPSEYVNYVIEKARAGYEKISYGTRRNGVGATVYDSNKYNMTRYINTTNRSSVLCADAYDMVTITSRYSTVLAFGFDPYEYYHRPAVGYTPDGTAELIYDIDGYDILGNKKNAYEVSTFVMTNAIESSSYSVRNDDINKFNVRLLNVNGDEVRDWDYFSDYKIITKTVTTKAISVRKGCGTYRVTVTCNGLSGNKVLTKTVTVVPSNQGVRFIVNSSGYSRYSKFYNGKAKCAIELDCEKSALKNFDGFQYVISKDKNFKDIYTKATTEFGKNHVSKAFTVKDGATFYTKYRVYTVVDGKKIYSEWKFHSKKIELR